MAVPDKAQSRQRPEWAKARRIVVKIGSSLLVDRATGRLNACWLNALADDMAQFAWRHREPLLTSSKIHTIPQGVALAKQAVATGRTPVVLADHSDRSGYATWLLREIVAQQLSDTLIATIADAAAIGALADAKPGDAFDGPVGGLADASAGEPVRITGAVLRTIDVSGQRWVSIGFGNRNVLLLSPYLVQIMEPSTLREIGLDPRAFAVIAIKSRVHFRRGFDDSGFAKTILLVEPPEPFLGTVRLEGLRYQNVDLNKFYPYGDPVFP